jgi:hypothetical protein
MKNKVSYTLSFFEKIKFEIRECLRAFHWLYFEWRKNEN